MHMGLLVRVIDGRLRDDVSSSSVARKTSSSSEMTSSRYLSCKSLLKTYKKIIKLSMTILSFFNKRNPAKVCDKNYRKRAKN